MGDIRSIPRDGKPRQDSNPEAIWQRNPNNTVPGVPDEEVVYDRPGDIRSIPRDGKSKNMESPEMIWQRYPNDNVPGVPDEDTIYDRPGDIKSIPRDGKPKNQDYPEAIWQRNPNNTVPGVPDEEVVFDRPGDMRSIPRDGKPKNPESPEMIWQRNPNEPVPGVPDEDVIFERPGDVKSIPRDGEPLNQDYPEAIWQRNLNEPVPGVPDEDVVYDRPTPHRLPEGYAYLVDTPEALAPLFHFINTKAPDSLPEEQLKTGEYSPFLQCPCTPQRVLNEENGTVDGWKPFPPFGTCSKQFYELENPSCSLETYKGGFRCCENGNYLIDTDNYNVDEFPEDVVYGKFVLTFLDDDARELGIKETTGIGHDVTGSLETRGNIEFDVPQCENGTLPEDCIYEQSTVMYADGGIDGSTDGKFLIPYTVGHLHVGGIDISLYDDSTGELICRSEAIYGNGTEPANEENYIVGMTPCYFDDPPVFNKNDKFRIVSRYNNTKPHFGVMSLFLSTSHEIDA